MSITGKLIKFPLSTGKEGLMSITGKLIKFPLSTGKEGSLSITGKIKINLSGEK